MYISRRFAKVLDAQQKMLGAQLKILGATAPTEKQNLRHTSSSAFFIYFNTVFVVLTSKADFSFETAIKFLWLLNQLHFSISTTNYYYMLSSC